MKLSDFQSSIGRMKFPVTSVDIDMKSTYPELAENKTFKKLFEQPNSNKIVQWICLAFDPKMRKIVGTNTADRYENSTNLIGKGKEWAEEIRKEKTVTDCIVEFLFIVHGAEYAMLIVDEEIQKAHMKSMLAKSMSGQTSSAEMKDYQLWSRNEKEAAKLRDRSMREMFYYDKKEKEAVQNSVKRRVKEGFHPESIEYELTEQ